MLFNSYEFIFIFLPITFFIYFMLNNIGKESYSKVFLSSASLFFYAWWDIVYLPLLLGSIFFNFSIGTIFSNDKIQKNTKKMLLVLGILGNLFLLGYFKYMDFLIENYNTITTSEYSLLKIALPLAISFFTFQQISYLVDSYKGYIKEYKIIDYIVFVTFFPQLIAGPIVHHKEMIPQFKDKSTKRINFENISKGLMIFSIGLFKKVVIADSFSASVEQGFDIQEKLNFIESYMSSVSFYFQLYYDFSGYSDMAIGLALLFNIKLPINFFAPYKATNIQEFWQRWHMTLSRFIKDYLYIPLGGNRVSDNRLYLNLIIVFFATGIWHGAGWTFIIWGLLHGFAIIIFRLWSKFNIKLNFVLAWFITFNFLVFAGIFFRAKDLDSAQKIIEGLIGLNGFGISSLIGMKYLVVGSVLLMIITLFTKNSIEHLQSFKPSVKSLVFTSFIFSISVIFLTRVSEFLYFNF